ncbi:MAG: DCC1-like thiol-disulfide oxidoreductase family protein [Bacteroidales bacterium]|nr:DCC1-like thiol-disulfide oxidoreductase family protein [Bacteroidales bacterium]
MKHSVVIYDHKCAICTATVAFLKKRERLSWLVYVPYDKTEGKEILKTYSLDFSAEQYIVFIKEQKVFVKSGAVLEILKEAGGLWSALYVFIIVPAPLRDFVYNFIAKNRYILKR